MTNFLKLASASVVALALTACATSPMDKAPMTDESDMMKSEGVMFGGAMMYPSKTIVENASAADNLTTLVALVKQAELVDTLSGPGPFTVFAPTDDAFAVIPDAVKNQLMEDRNRPMLQNILTYHVLPGKITASDLMAMISANGGTYSAETVSGTDLTFRVIDGKVKVIDENNAMATVTAADVLQSNGVVHIINAVLMPQ